MEPVFMAQIMLFGGNFAPRGWAFCQGQLLPINQNQALFSLLGTIYGGDGRTTFALPDLRGRTPVHPGDGPGLSNWRLGQRKGTEFNNMTINQMPGHHHSLTTGVITGEITIGVNGDEPGTDNANGAVLGATDGNKLYNTEAVSASEKLAGATSNLVLGGQSGNVGASQAINNIKPSIGINYIIALQGPFPSRS